MVVRLLSSAFATFYWIGIYIKPKEGLRDDPAVIKNTMVRIVTSTTVAIALGPFAAQKLIGGDYWQNFDLMGLQMSPKGVAIALGLTMTLFSGPIIHNGIPRPEWSWPDLRDYLFGPLTEELVYRSVIISFYKQAGLSQTRMIWETPLYFGLAHMHHALRKYRQGVPLRECITPAIAQLAMTTVFGAYASKLFLSLGSVWPSVAAHVFCNLMGPPDIDGPWWYRALLIGGLSAFAYGLTKL